MPEMLLIGVLVGIWALGALANRGMIIPILALLLSYAIWSEILR
jgi:hypothetical protein